MTTATTTQSSPDLPQLPPEMAALIPQVMQAMSENPDNDPRVRASALRMRAIGHQNQVGGLLAEADRLEHAAALAAEAVKADDLLADAERQVAALTDRVREAVARERAAADKLAEAAEHARQAADAVEELALAEAAPAAQTDAMVRQDKAERVAAQFRAAAERATAERNQAELVVAQAREVIRQGKARAKAAHDAVAHAAETVRPSAMTLTLDWQKLVTGGQHLTEGELAFIRALVEGFAQATGADKSLSAAAYRRAKAENDERFNRALNLLPASKDANLLPPGVRPGSAAGR
jgi:hypothetical protein